MSGLRWLLTELWDDLPWYGRIVFFLAATHLITLMLVATWLLWSDA